MQGLTACLYLGANRVGLAVISNLMSQSLSEEVII